MAISSEVTICLTSCGRWDLLEQTLKSLSKYWDGPSCKLLVYEDNNLPSIGLIDMLFDLCQSSVGSYFDVEIYHGKIGQIKAIDALYRHVQTPYIFHCEDDWEFYRSGFYAASKSILESLPKASMVWIRENNDRNGHPAVGQVRATAERVQYQKMSDSYRNGQWPGFSFNPGLRRLADYKAIFPDGYSGHAEFKPKAAWEAESKVAQAYRKAGYSAYTTIQGFVKHIGNGRHIQ